LVRRVHDAVAFSSAQLPTEHFNARFGAGSLGFWVPLLIDCCKIEAGHRVLDIGCGTGGFTRAIAEMAGAVVTGVDISERFIEFARDAPAPERGAVAWKVGSAEALPVPEGSFDRAVVSVVLHQVAHPELAVAEVFRSLAADGRVVVRTVAAEDVECALAHGSEAFYDPLSRLIVRSNKAGDPRKAKGSCTPASARHIAAPCGNRTARRGRSRSRGTSITLTGGSTGSG
jgi:SAM-dependent methyltransferase